MNGDSGLLTRCMDNQINGMHPFAVGEMVYGVVSAFRNRRDIGPMDVDIRGPDSIPEIGMVGNSDCRSAIKDAGPWSTQHQNGESSKSTYLVAGRSFCIFESESYWAALIILRALDSQSRRSQSRPNGLPCINLRDHDPSIRIVQPHWLEHGTNDTVLGSSLRHGFSRLMDRVLAAWSLGTGCLLGRKEPGDAIHDVPGPLSRMTQ